MAPYEKVIDDITDAIVCSLGNKKRLSENTFLRLNKGASSANNPMAGGASMPSDPMAGGDPNTMGAGMDNGWW